MFHCWHIITPLGTMKRVEKAEKEKGGKSSKRPWGQGKKRRRGGSEYGEEGGSCTTRGSIHLTLDVAPPACLRITPSSNSLPVTPTRNDQSNIFFNAFMHAVYQMEKRMACSSLNQVWHFKFIQKNILLCSPLPAIFVNSPIARFSFIFEDVDHDFQNLSQHFSTLFHARS